MGVAIKKSSPKGAYVARVSDANTIADLSAALQGAGMFDSPAGGRTVVLDGICANEDMRGVLMSELPVIARSRDSYFMFEEKPDADTRKHIEKYADTRERYDAVARGKDTSVFKLADALRARDKKALWVGLHREFGKGKAPEAIHGVLFWAVKDMFVKARTDEMRTRAKRLLSELAEVPHESRRRGEELEYALERFALSGL